MSRFKLSAGTIVKHGTSSIHLNAIFRNGLVAGNGEAVQAKPTRSQQAGVAVGELIAYGQAWAAHAQLVNAFLASYLAWPDMAQDFYQHTARARGKYALKEVPFSLPVVLNIKLPVDVGLTADEQLLRQDPDATTDEAGWLRWKSGALLQTIPASWITSFEYPSLLCVEELLDQRATGALAEDMFLFLLGKRAGLDRTVATTYARQRPLDLPHKLKFSQAGIDSLLNDARYTDHENRFVNQCAQQSLLDQQQQDIHVPH